MNKITLTFILSITTYISFACDVCGAYMGTITPFANKNNISVLYRYRSFNGYDAQKNNLFPTGSSFLIPNDKNDSSLSSHNGNPTDYEVYRTLELRGKYFINNKLEINAILPYLSNSEQYNNNLATISGLGDVNLYLGYHLLQQLKYSTKHQLIVGGGLKLPTGSNKIKNIEGVRYATLMQPSTGSLDAFIYFNYLIGLGNFGASINTSYKINSNNSDQEGIANSTASFLNIFYKYDINKEWKILPSAQFYYEYSAGETYKNQKTGNHVMNNLMGGIGLDFYYKNISLNTSIQKNIWEAKTIHPQSAGRVNIGLSYNF